jgi:cytochrome oxidase Cu insertion factor (SCO1/SenC/PrrC family)
VRLPHAFLFVALVTTGQGEVIDLIPKRGQPVAPIHWIDESGRARELSQFSGYPIVLLPIYTRCRSACVQNVARLKEALADPAIDSGQFRVLLFSFDANDTPAIMTNYRHRENIPLGWSIGTASQTNIDVLLDSVGVQVGKAGTEFTHPNLVLFLDPKLRVAKWIYGTDYSNGDINLALQVASGRSDWIGRHSDMLYALLLFAATLLCVALFQQLRRPKGIANSAL